MAIQIQTNGKVKRVSPSSGFFTLSMIDNLVGGWPEPNKVGPVWVIHNENHIKSEDNFNYLASNFLKDDIHGDVLIISANELPSDWDIKTDYDLEHPAEEIDESILKAISDARSIEYGGTLVGSYSKEFLKSMMNEDTRSEYHFRPSQTTEEAKKEESYIKFLRSAYEFVLDDSTEKFKVYEDESAVITIIDKKEKVIALEQIIELYEGEEEYEKCTKLIKRKRHIEETE